MNITILTKTKLDYTGNPYGLNNSAQFLTDALTAQRYNIKYVPVVDGNSIDKAVTEEKSGLVIIEALWVTPEKMQELAFLHPHITWIIRIHSNVPFLSMEGTALAMTKQLAKIKKVFVVCNNEQTADELSKVLSIHIGYLPNIYHKPTYCPHHILPTRSATHDTLNISCFGAIRPFKNQMMQAMAAIWAAEQLKKILRFHINVTRIEQFGDPVLKNIVACFEGTPHELVNHAWQPHNEFLKIIAETDLSLQVSFTESFNIVSADSVHVGVPLVVSPEIKWLEGSRMAHPTSLFGIGQQIIEALKEAKTDVKKNTKLLNKYNEDAVKVWNHFLIAHNVRKNAH